MKCPYCGSDDLFYDTIMYNWICEECNRIMCEDELNGE